jgi:hypothetical protein
LLATLSRGCADDHLVGEIVRDALGVPRANVPLRLFGGAHYLVLAGQAEPYWPEDPWRRFRALLEEHRDWLRAFVSEQVVQTNEVRRSWALLPGILASAPGESVDVVELGPSAGLNLLFDRYVHRYVQGTWGDESGALVLTGKEHGLVPAGVLERPLSVRRRAGIDRAPVDVTTTHGARLLEAFVWPDEPERLERVRQAIEIVRRNPPELVTGDFVELVGDVVERGTPTVVFDSNATEYLDDDCFALLARRIGEIGRTTPLAWVSIELPRAEHATSYVLETERWPGGARRRVANVHYHGAWLDWIAG